MRRAQSVRNYGRPSIVPGSDDLSMLREEPDDSPEDALRRQLIEKDRENDKVSLFIPSLGSSFINIRVS